MRAHDEALPGHEYKDEDVGRGFCVVLEGKGKSERVPPTFLTWSSPFDVIVKRRRVTCGLMFSLSANKLLRCDSDWDH